MSPTQSYLSSVILARNWEHDFFQCSNFGVKKMTWSRLCAPLLGFAMETESIWWWLLLKAEVIRPDHKEHLAVNKEHIQMALRKLQIQIHDFVFRNQLHVSSHAEYWQFTQIPSTAEGRWYLSFAFKHAIKVFSHYLLSLPLLMLSQSNKGLCQPPAVTYLFHTGCWGRGNEELK